MEPLAAGVFVAIGHQAGATTGEYAAPLYDEAESFASWPAFRQTNEGDLSDMLAQRAAGRGSFAAAARTEAYQ